MSANPDTEKGSGSSSALLNQPIVLDVGTASIKAGFAGGGKPKVCNVLRNLRYHHGNAQLCSIYTVTVID
jgi:hypothetical protein